MSGYGKQWRAIPQPRNPAIPPSRHPAIIFLHCAIPPSRNHEWNFRKKKLFKIVVKRGISDIVPKSKIPLPQKNKLLHNHDQYLGDGVQFC